MALLKTVSGSLAHRIALADMCHIAWQISSKFSVPSDDFVVSCDANI